ncbi:Uncharacterised protein [Escherichia coli]|uniref:Uncharacterized protein n=1 Tax=Escherichia coli TaxID=562 RepID=A0A376LDX1_ECOLX|nr:Uncharacterised protein [Escherichia coli]
MTHVFSRCSDVKALMTRPILVINKVIAGKIERMVIKPVITDWRWHRLRP